MSRPLPHSSIAIVVARAYIGTSGWDYEGWRDTFYDGCPRTQWLPLCAKHFSAVEVNATFYRMQRPETFRRWRNLTPADFRFAIKANRYLTHNRKLLEPVPAVVLERDRASALDGKLAAVLWQLPGNLHLNLGKLQAFAQALQRWRSVRHAVEFRHESWFNDEVAQCLQQHRVAVCQSDAADWPMWNVVTTDLVYARLHGHRATYVSGYRESELQEWARRVRRWQREGREVHVYFDNDALGHAPRNAMRLAELVGRKRVS